MAFLEKSNWVVLIVGVPTVVIYLALIVPQLLQMPAADVSWVPPMLFAVVAFVVANVVGNIVAAISNPSEAEKNDERDKEIDRFGDWVGNWLIIAGAFVGLVLAMAELDQFWIGNAIFLGGIAGSMLSSATKIAAYHGPFQRW